MTASTMQAARYHRYGDPTDVLQVDEVPRVAPGAGEVQVRVSGAGAGGGEPAIMAGRLRRLLRTRFPAGVGVDFAGTVSAVGSGVGTRRVGDAVWGLVPHRTFGSIAEYVTVPHSRVAPAPRDLDLVLAASLPAAGTTVLTALQDKARLRPGERLLVRGASGGVGAVAVQLGRSMGAHVTGLASRANLDWVRGLGADEVVDYLATDADALGTFDVVLDLVGTDLDGYLRRLAPGGRLLPLALDPGSPLRTLVAMGWANLRTRGRVPSFSNDPSQAQLTRLTRLVESGVLQPTVDSEVPLQATAAAFERLRSGGVRGKVVIAMGPGATR
ncbi:NAD(P)-dependent alcohol dehydrogenase [Auraticoccus monumenti]|uniref:NADPH:quinone reductase n=1 Tax=Auraticoccus monumenti TaxID=675864 RepID=A0A1G7BGK4_9ACTN|nr:NAD(P)-dependent alcohol dehydrogenase [Auraticoccus monumenti]SDE25880.1 NADPH:quinone reductase [Auraticoccus monumenti]